jgi:hypothetical protein
MPEKLWTVHTSIKSNKEEHVTGQDTYSSEKLNRKVSITESPS